MLKVTLLQIEKKYTSGNLKVFNVFDLTVQLKASRYSQNQALLIRLYNYTSESNNLLVVWESPQGDK